VWLDLVNKLNFGCGRRIAEGWTNIDFHSDDARVLRANLLSGFPFPDRHFDVVYSSHVLEHFTPAQGASLIKESWRVLKPGGIVRIVVPDLEAICREYLRILALDDCDPCKLPLYNWSKIELLDQLVRSKPRGLMGPLSDSVLDGDDEKMIAYVHSRTESQALSATTVARTNGIGRIKRITRQKIATRLIYYYLAVVKSLIPKNLLDMVFNGTSVGEKHRWMYDGYGMNILMEANGFANIRIVAFNESEIIGFNSDYLDSNADGTPYKNVSLYCEAIKP
jgi:SAM-dependent methyltransferase